MPRKRKEEVLEVVEVQPKPIEKFLPKKNEYLTELYIYGEKFEANVKRCLGLEESIMFVNDVVDQVVDQDGVRFSIKDFAVAFATVRYYTDIDLPEDCDVLYQLFTSTYIADRITSVNFFDNVQYKSLLAAIDKQIEFEMQKHLLDVRKECEKAVEEFKAVTEVLVQSTKLFEGITPDQMQKFVGAMQDGFDEKKIVDLVMEQQNKTKPKSKKSDKRVLDMKPSPVKE